jgi:sulfide:quinone oxidoreductase
LYAHPSHAAERVAVSKKEPAAVSNKKIVILGAGFGGLETATGLATVLRGRNDYDVTVIDKSDSFFVGFAKIDVLFGDRTEPEVRYRYANLRADGARFVQAAVTSIDTDAKQVATSAGSFGYDYLVVALGAELDYDATPGFRESGAHEFYSMSGALRLKPVIEAFSSGSLVLGILGLPYKCPPAPYEVACRFHDLFLRKGIRDRVTLTVVSPGARLVPSPNIADVLERLLAERGIEFMAGTPITAIDAARKQVVVGTNTVDYDCFIGVPVHVPPAVVRTSQLGKGFVQASSVNLETSVPGVYAIGDVAKIPVGEDRVIPKGGGFAEDAARTVVSDILSKEGLVSSVARFRGKGSCYLDLGGGLVARIDNDYLSAEKPQNVLEGPTPNLRADRSDFDTSRRDRWFKF